MRKALPLAALALSLTVASAADAALFRIEGSGSISSAGSDFVTGGFAVGQAASFVWEYDTSVAASSSSTTAATYNATTFVSFTFNGQSFETSPGNGFIQVADQPTSAQLSDQSSPLDKTFAGVSGLRYQIFLNGTSGLLSGLDLPTSLDITKLTPSVFRFSDGTGSGPKDLTALIDTGTVTVSPVAAIPIPASLPLLAGAMGLVWAFRRRRSPEPARA